MNCPECTSEIAEESRSCPSCGAGIEESYAKTRILPDDSKPASGRRISSPSQPTHRTTAPSRQSSIHLTSDSLDHARFVSGTILNDRYRIVGLLGRGGMGEVYRAEDLKLEQPVALKFLPETLSFDGAALARFHREVRVARQISHRNVCRVYDIGEFDGLHFLSMEYIRGEELSSVLKRFGRLPVDKAVDIARQVCAGLTAAHDAGVLHRDLKPANVMIDENGDVRITDFGLAGLVEEFGEGAALEGTPEYMSPEQLEGRELTSRSDIYSLGLVIYELFTGRKAFSAKTLNELLRLRRTESLPESPSRYVKDLDPLVERVIERCLSADPKERPASALQVAAALPGGDPLAAALAAGETPSPEMVAAAPKQGSLRPAVAVALLSGALILFALCFALTGSVYLHRWVPLEKSVQALQDRAWDISSRLGYPSATDRASGFAANNEYISHVNREDHSSTRWELLKTGHPSGIVFWYRQSPRYLEPFNREDVTPQDPPRTIAGMVGLTLDMRGRLLGFEAVPPQVLDKDAPPAPFDWSKLFNEAGLDISTFRQVAPEWVSPHAFDAQAAWEGIYPGQPETKLRIEAASFRGRPVYFQLVNPWKQPIRQDETPLPAPERILQAVIIVIFLVVLVGAALLARHNLRLGRGDRKGALRLAGFVFVLTNVTWIFGSHHVPSVNGEFSTFIQSLSFSLLVGCLLWLIYIALEPFVRRRWPGRIISWNRLLAGDWRDPLVGRDLLLGAFFGSALVLVGYLQIFIPRWLGMPPTQPATVVLKGLLGFHYVPNLLVAQILNSLTFPAVFMFLVLLLTIITRHERIAIVLFGLLYAALYLGGSSNLFLDGTLGLIISAATIFILLRFGMLTLVFTQFFVLFFNFYPVTSDLSAWYAGSSAFAALLGAGLILYGFKSSLAGQQIFKGSLVGD